MALHSQISQLSIHKNSNSNSELFTDRDDYRSIFWEELKSHKNGLLFNNPIHKIIVYYGVGGVGKSTLQLKLIKEIEEDVDNLYIITRINFEDTGRINQEVSLSEIRKDLKLKYKVKFKFFDIASCIYRQALNPSGVVDKASFLENLDIPLDTLNFIFDVLDLKTFGMAGGAVGIVGKIAKKFKLDEKLLHKLAPDIQEFVSLLKDKELNELEKLLPAFLAMDLKNHWQENQEIQFVFFLDTYEKIAESDRSEGHKTLKDTWIRELILNLPEVFWIICGREQILWGEDIDAEWDNYLIQHKLDNFSLENSIIYLLKFQIEDEKIQNKIFDSSKGYPFYLNLSAETYQRIIKNRTPTIEDFDGTYKEIYLRFIRHLDDEVDALRILALLQWWDKDVFHTLMKEFYSAFNRPSSFDKIIDFSFIEEAEKGNGRYYIHQLMKEHLLNESKLSNELAIHEFLFDYYKTKIDQTTEFKQRITFIKLTLYHASFFLELEKQAEILGDMMPDDSSYHSSFFNEFRNSFSSFYGKLKTANKTNTKEFHALCYYQSMIAIFDGNFESGENLLKEGIKLKIDHNFDTIMFNGFAYGLLTILPQTNQEQKRKYKADLAAFIDDCIKTNLFAESDSKALYALLHISWGFEVGKEIIDEIIEDGQDAEFQAFADKLDFDYITNLKVKILSLKKRDKQQTIYLLFEEIINVNHDKTEFMLAFWMNFCHDIFDSYTYAKKENELFVLINNVKELCIENESQNAIQLLWVYFYLGKVYLNQNIYSGAINNFKVYLSKAGAYYKENPIINVLWVNRDIGRCFRYTEDFQNSIPYYQEAIRLSLKFEQNDAYRYLNYELAKSYEKLESINESIKYLDIAFFTFPEITPYDEFDDYVMFVLENCYIHITNQIGFENWQECLQHYEEFLQKYRNSSAIPWRIRAYWSVVQINQLNEELGVSQFNKLIIELKSYTGFQNAADSLLGACDLIIEEKDEIAYELKSNIHDFIAIKKHQTSFGLLTINELRETVETINALKENNIDAAAGYKELATIYSKIKDHKNSVYYYEKSYIIYFNHNKLDEFLSSLIDWADCFYGYCASLVTLKSDDIFKIDHNQYLIYFEDLDKQNVNFARNVGNLFYNNQIYNLSIIWHEKALETYIKLEGESSYGTAISYLNFANSLAYNEYYGEALNYYEKAFELLKRHITQNDLEIVIQQWNNCFIAYAKILKEDSKLSELKFAYEELISRFQIHEIDSQNISLGYEELINQ